MRTTSDFVKSRSRSSSGRPIVRRLGVEDGDAVAETLGFLEPVGGEKDGDAAFAQAVDQLVHLAGCDRIETGGRLVEEDDRRIAEQRACERDALAEPLREAAAGIVRAAGEVDRRQRLPDPRLRLCELVQPGEELEVLGHGETQVEAGVLGHHRDPLADLDAVRRVEQQTRDAGRARGGGDQGGEHAHGGRLAGAVRAEKAEHLTGGDAEGDIIDRDPLPEPLRQMLDDQRRLARRSSSTPARESSARSASRCSTPPTPVSVARRRSADPPERRPRQAWRRRSRARRRRRRQRSGSRPECAPTSRAGASARRRRARRRRP